MSPTSYLVVQGLWILDCRFWILDWRTRFTRFGELAGFGEFAWFIRLIYIHGALAVTDHRGLILLFLQLGLRGLSQSSFLLHPRVRNVIQLQKCLKPLLRVLRPILGQAFLHVLVKIVIVGIVVVPRFRHMQVPVDRGGRDAQVGGDGPLAHTFLRHARYNLGPLPPDRVQHA